MYKSILFFFISFYLSLVPLFSTSLLHTLTIENMTAHFNHFQPSKRYRINDSTADTSEKITFREWANSKKYFMKFRGTVSFVWDYMLEHQDGVNPGNHFLPNNYTELDYTDKNDSHHSTGDPGRKIGGTWGGMQAKLYLHYHFIAPFLTANNPLMKDNNIKFSFYGELSPVTMNFGMGVTLTPVAFLTFQSGFLLGNGWKLTDTLAGLGLNNNGIIERQKHAGPHLQLWFSSTFQIDLAFILPEKIRRWTHVVVLATPMLKYQALLNIDEDQPYMYEECPGEQLGGWRFLAEFLLGYRFYIIEDDIGEDQMFIKMRHNNFIITTGMYVWIDYLNLTHFNDSPMSNGWGSDFTYINFGPAVQFDLPNNIWFKLFFFFRNDRAYTSETVGNLDFRDRIYEDYYIFFRWFGIFAGWNF
ncbi:MAG: hypothetical protein MJB14_06180 [Spirochaetes bacterium]|nr:hypothetical protein [Spirochaetota bacterium]